MGKLEMGNWKRKGHGKDMGRSLEDPSSARGSQIEKKPTELVSQLQRPTSAAALGPGSRQFSPPGTRQSPEATAPLRVVLGRFLSSRPRGEQKRQRTSVLFFPGPILHFLTFVWVASRRRTRRLFKSRGRRPHSFGKKKAEAKRIRGGGLEYRLDVYVSSPGGRGGGLHSFGT